MGGTIKTFVTFYGFHNCLPIAFSSTFFYFLSYKTFIITRVPFFVSSPRYSQLLLFSLKIIPLRIRTCIWNLCADNLARSLVLLFYLFYLYIYFSLRLRLKLIIRIFLELDQLDSKLIERRNGARSRGKRTRKQ